MEKQINNEYLVDLQKHRMMDDFRGAIASYVVSMARLKPAETQEALTDAFIREIDEASDLFHTVISKLVISGETEATK